MGVVSNTYIYPTNISLNFQLVVSRHQHEHTKTHRNTHKHTYAGTNTRTHKNYLVLGCAIQLCPIYLYFLLATSVCRRRQGNVCGAHESMRTPQQTKMQYKQPSLHTIFHIYKTISYVLDAHSQTSNALAKTWHCTVHCSIICSFYYNAQSLSMLECVGASVCMLSARVCALRTKHCANRQTRYSSSRWKYCVVVYACSLCSAIINCLRWCWLAMMPNHRNASPTTVGQHIIFSIHFTRQIHGFHLNRCRHACRVHNHSSFSVELCDDSGDWCANTERVCVYAWCIFHFVRSFERAF